MSFNNFQNYLVSIGISVDFQSKVILSILAITVLFVLRSIGHRILTLRINDHQLLYRWQKFFSYVVYVFFFLVVGGIWYQGVQSIATFLGLVSAGLAVALKDYIANFASWLFILWKEPFKVGHRIEVGDTLGDVIDIGIFQMSLLEIENFSNAEQPSGRIVFLPNNSIFNTKVANYDISFPFIWHEINVVVTFESQWKRAKEIILEEIQGNSLIFSEENLKKYRLESRQFLLPEMTLDPTIYTSAEDHGIQISARFVCGPRNRRQIEKKVWESILDRFEEEAEIDFAYPTHRIFQHQLEGKPSMRAK